MSQSYELTIKPDSVRLSEQRQATAYWAERARRAEEACEALVRREECLLERLRVVVGRGSPAAGVLAEHGVALPVLRSPAENLAVLERELREFDLARAGRRDSTN